ncbi:terminase large subunit [Arthrobacter phage Shambre1]|uniref:Terminase large subunit n=1 Tax=Arthrobacter phage Shambre1 TaxID=2927284 RepID=A0A977KNJ1_9CAUD|nr:terminase large subunit [Arthrobacter phage Shambre1]UXE04740.1 terminase large subunit [Arthrobacter phage Shambre1]
MAPTAQTRSRKPAAPETDSFGLPTAAVLRRLKISAEVAYYMVTRGIPLPDCVPKVKTPEPRWVKGAQFDPERVDKVMAAFKNLRHTQGRLAGQPLTPDPWQVAYIIAPVFGWVKRNDYGEWVRIIRNLYVDVPRKNGKSTLAGGFAIYLTAADGEEGAQVIAAASTKDQAGFVFAPIKVLAEKAPALRGLVKPLGSKIIHRRTGSYFGVVSSAADAQHGANIHGAIIDELHVHKNGLLVEAIETGTGSRSQPLVVKITTADSGKPNTVYANNRKYVEQLEKGVFKDETVYGVVFAADDDADPFSEASMRKANPGYGVSPTREFLQAAAKKARNSPTELASYKRLHLGIRTKQTTSFIDLKDWQRNAGKPIDETLLRGMECYGGLDLGSVSDLTAFALIFPHEHDDGYEAIFRFWTPEDNLDALDKRTNGNASKLWVANGWLKTTPGNVTDYDFIKEQVLKDCDEFDVVSIGLDRWNSTHLSNQLIEEGVPLVKIGQGFVSMNGPMKELQRLVLKGRRGAEKLHHGGNPVMTWMVDNLAVAEDPAGNVKPDKANSGDKIDGVSAIANALSEALNPEQEQRPDTEHGLIIA